MTDAPQDETRDDTPGPEESQPVAPDDVAPGTNEPEPATTSDDPAASEDPKAATAPEAPAPSGDQKPATAYSRLAHALRPAVSRSQLLAAVLCAVLGFALVAQIQHSGQDDLAALRQDDLVRLLDDLTNRNEQLDAEVSRLQASRDELATGTDSAQAALDLAQARAAAEGILSGRLPAEGPGIRVVMRDPQGKLEASHMVNMLEELRNAGTEVAQVNGVRIVASTSFVDGADGIVVDGTLIQSPYEWLAIGDPPTLDRALEIPGGALPTVRLQGATTSEIEQLENVTVDAVVELTDPRFARPADPDQ